MLNDEYILILCIISYYFILGLSVKCYDNKEQIMIWFKHTYENVASCLGIRYKTLKEWIIRIWDMSSSGEKIRALFNIICYAGALCWLIWAFENHWIRWYTIHIDQYINMPVELANILLITYAFILILSSVIHGIYKRQVRWKSVCYAIAIVAPLYVWFRKISNTFMFTTLSFVETGLTYVDCLIILSAIYIVALVVLDKRSTKFIKATFVDNAPYYYRDAPIAELDDDTLGFKDYVPIIAEKIRTLTRDHSWSVGVIGSWGSGKTSFLNLIKLQLEQTGKYLIVEFNPRMASKPQKIQEMALDCLEEAISPYNTNSRSLMRKYMFALQLEGANGWVQVALSWLKSAYGVERAKDELNKALGELPKQVVFIFDDFDRLTKEEILEVLKLIDGNANFDNIIYFAAYDREQVAKLLDSETYIEKYFGIEIHVPLTKDANLISYLFNELRGMVPAKPQDDKLARSLDDVIIRHWVIFKRGLSTLRDVKRFLNVVKTDVLTMYTIDLDTEDFILLEFLKYHHIGLYETLWHLPEKYASYKEYVTVRKEIDKQEELDDIDKNVLKVLFPTDSNSNNHPAKIRKRDNYASYFIRSEQSGSAVKLSDIYSLSTNDSTLRTILDKACEDENVLKNLCDSIEQFGRRYIDDEASMKRYLDVILYLNSAVGDTHIIPETRLICRDSFYATVNEQRHIGIDHKPMGDYILNYYRAKQWTPGDISFLNGVVPDLYRGDADRDYVFSYKEIAPIISNGFARLGETYLQSKSEENFKSLISVFYLCVDHIEEDTTRIILDINACRKMHDIILQAPATYINYFVRLGGKSTAADVNYIACEPFWKQIFGSAEAMEAFMAQLKDSEYPRLVRMRNYWQLFKANGFQMIRFAHQGNVQEIINNDLVEQVNQLEELQRLLSQVKQIRFKDNRAERFKVASEIEKQANRIPLEVKIKYEILQETKLYMPRAS